MYVGEGGSIVVPANTLKDQLRLETEAIKQMFGFDERQAQYLINYRSSQGAPPTGIAIIGKDYPQTNVPPGYVRLSTATHEGDFYRAYKAQLEAAKQQQYLDQLAQQRAYEQAVQQQRQVNLQLQADLLKASASATPEQNAALNRLEQTLINSGKFRAVDRQAQQFFENITRYTNPSGSQAQALSDAARLQILLQDYRQAQEIWIFGHTLTPAIRDSFEALFHGENPHKQLPNEARINIIRTADRQYEDWTGQPADRNTTLWKVLRDSQVDQNYADISIEGSRLVTSSPPPPPLPTSNLLQDQLNQGRELGFLLERPQVSSPGDIGGPVSGPNVPGSDGASLSAPSESAPINETLQSRPLTPVDEFRYALQIDALVQLNQSRNRLTTELEQYQSLGAPQWQTLRQIAAKDDELQTFQVEAVDALTEFVENNITHGKMVWPGLYDVPAKGGDLSARREGLLQYLNSNEAWAQELAQHRPQLEQLLDKGDLVDQTMILQAQLRSQYPALEVLGSHKILETASNHKLYLDLSRDYGQVIEGISQLEQRIIDHPNRALQLDLTVARTLEQFADSPHLKEITDWVKSQREQDNLIKGVGTTTTLVLAGAAILLTKNPQVATGLGLGAGLVGGATALYELPQLEDVDSAAQASLGGGELTSTEREAARLNLWLGRANVVLAGADLGLPAVARAAPEVMNIVAQLSPQQAKEVLQASKLALAGKVPEAQRLIQQVKGQVSDSQLVERLDALIPQLLRSNPEAGHVVPGAVLGQPKLETAFNDLAKRGFSRQQLEVAGVANTLGQHPNALPRLLQLSDAALNQAMSDPKALQEAIRRAEFADSFIGKKLNDLTPDQLQTLEQAYNVDKNDVIRRNSVDDGYPQLTVKDGTIREGAGRVSDRLSNRTEMLRNYIKAYGPVPKGHQLHHLLPDSIVRDHELTRLAIKAGYNLDEASNLLALPYTREALETANLKLVHLGSHDGWGKYVTERLGDLRTALIKEHGSLANVPSEVWLQKMKGLEQEFRDLLTSGDIQQLRDLEVIKDYILDGKPAIRLSENETQRNPNVEIASATPSAETQSPQSPVSPQTTDEVIHAAAASILATKDITDARALVANSPEAQRLANDPDAQAQYIDHTLWLGLNLAQEAGQTVPEPTVQPIQSEHSVAAEPTQTSPEELGYIHTLVEATSAYLNGTPGPPCASKCEKAVEAGLRAVIEQHPDVPERTFKLLAESIVEHLQDQLDAVAANNATVAQATIDELSL